MRNNLTGLFTNCFLFFLLSAQIAYSQENNFDAARIAANNYNSIVKILLIDSVAEKHNHGKGYLGRGSGFLVSEDGLIFTNRHVVKNGLGYVNYKNYDKANREYYIGNEIYSNHTFEENYYKINHIRKASIIVQVFTSRNGSSSNLYVAQIIAIDSTNYDGAILKIVSDMNGNPVYEKFNPIEIGNSDSTYQGEDLCIYGFPAQYDGSIDAMLKDQSTLTFGKHSGFDYFVNADYGFIKTDAAINSGNSGGAVFNKQNKVIGISTSASKKSNIGFIAGINGMYNISVKDSLVKKQLNQLKLISPINKQAKTSGIISFPEVNLPQKAVIRKYNIESQIVRKFAGGYWYFRGGYSIMNKDRFVFNDPSLSSSIFKGPFSDEPLKVQTLSSYQFEIGKTNPILRFNNFNKISLDWTILNLTNTTYDWSKANIFDDALGGIYNYNPSSNFIRVTTKLGLMYSVLIKRRLQLDFYYKIGANTCGNNEYFIYQYINYGNSTNGLIGDKLLNFTSFGLINTYGLHFNYRSLTFGIEYTNGQQKFYLDNILAKPVSNNKEGSPYPTSSYAGKYTTENLNLSIGISFGSERKWKNLKE